MPEQNMQPVTNPELVDAMATFRLDLTNRDNEKAFLQAAVNARYMLPAQVQPIETEEGEPKQHRIAFQIMNTPDGKRFMPAYTDEVELKKNRKPDEQFQVAIMGFPQIYQFVKQNEPITGVVINPFGSALCLHRGQIIAIGDAQGDITAGLAPVQKKPEAVAVPVPQQPVQQPNNVLGAVEATREQQQAAIRAAMADLDSADEKASEPLKAEDVITDDLLGALKAFLKKQKAVKKAYIQPANESGENYLLVALEADESADIDSIGNSLTTECADYSDLPFECVPASSIRAKELVANEKPFYEKKRFGIF